VIIELVDQLLAYIYLISEVITGTGALLLSAVWCHCPHIWSFLTTTVMFEAQLVQVGTSYIG
jgi:hypothetical protein